MSILPLEIIETIISILAQDDLSFSATKACALVCHEFHHLCRKHIFAAIALDDTHTQPSPPFERMTKATTSMLQRLLDTFPEIADHIRSLRYNIAADDFQNASLAQTFRKITRLRSLCIFYFGKPRLQWNDNPLRPVLLHLLHLPTLSRFRIISAENFLVSDLASCINLDHLEFENLMAFDGNETLASNLPEKSIRLRKLAAGLKSSAAIMKMCTMECADGIPLMDFSYLSDLSIMIHRQNEVQASLSLLSRCKQLTNIIVDLQVWDSTVDFTHIGLSKLLYPSMQTLKRISVKTSFAEETGSDDPLAGLSNELKAMKNNNVVETINIEVDVEIDSDCKRGDEWGRLDAALEQSGWPKLRQVSLTIVVWSYARASDELERALRRLPQTQFPKLSSSKSLSFDFSVRGQPV